MATLIPRPKVAKLVGGGSGVTRHSRRNLMADRFARSFFLGPRPPELSEHSSSQCHSCVDDGLCYSLCPRFHLLLILRYPATAQYPTCFHPSRSHSFFLRARQNLTLRLRPSLSNSPHHPLRYSNLLSRRLVCISGWRFLAEVLRSRFSVC